MATSVLIKLEHLYLLGSLIAFGLSAAGIPIIQQLLLSAAMCLVSAWLGRKLVEAERAA